MTKFDKNRKKLLLLCVGVFALFLGVDGGSGSVKSGKHDSSNNHHKSTSVSPEPPPQPQQPSPKAPTPPPTATQLTTDPLQSLLIISTLDGSLTALDAYTGELRWISHDKPMIQVPNHQGNIPATTHFLPDPKTGSLYMMGKQNSLRKLPFTIPQLVSMAPCRNSEGLMYTGTKHDMWVTLNPYTGEKHDFPDGTCPAGWGTTKEDHCEALKGPLKTLLIGKTEYTLSMRDGAAHWNVSYNHYSSKDNKNEHEFVHFTSPSEGNLITYDRISGEMLWQVVLESPVIGVYSIEQQGMNLLSVPFNPIATATLETLRNTGSSKSKALSQTTYVGECAYGLYAVPALADENQRLITEGLLPPLLEGPGELEGETGGLGGSGASQPDDFLLLGYYEVKENAVAAIQPNQIEDTTSEEAKLNESLKLLFDEKVISVDKADKGVNTETSNSSKSPNTLPFPAPITTQPAPPQQKKREIKIVFTTAVISVAITGSIMGFIFVLYRRHKNKQLEAQVSKVKMLSNDSNGGAFASGDSGVSTRSSVTSLNSTEFTVGKITVFPNEILGKGCEGTFVFRGTFETRNVAVKRIIPECFQFADTEVDLLKESDQHVNVIRYFCTETDGQFRYIALELCVATLADWVEGKWECELNPVELLRGATEGLSYLHSKRIVHRDVKPANVLLSYGDCGVRTLISDFGLCKRIQVDRNSYSRRSGGVPGTDGWIAPEVLSYSAGIDITNGESEGGTIQYKRMTYSVDIFSMGCVYYYVLTQGRHPFGDPFLRQSNILTGKHQLDLLNANTRGAYTLVAQMISMDPNERPPLEAVLLHPLFWSSDKVLNFFLDVSDRIEKESEDKCPVLRLFESGSSEVVRGDWRDHICTHVALDLRRFRTYRGESVRDLLRALRNKKNHYRELSKEVKDSLGEIPDGFVDYWVGRFPKLLEYTWATFEGVKDDLRGYYYSGWDFNERSEDCSWGLMDQDENSSVVVDPGKVGKDLWKSKSQEKYRRWRGNGRGGGGGGGRGSPRRFQSNSQVVNTNEREELSASTDNYWRSKSPAKKDN